MIREALIQLLMPVEDYGRRQGLFFGIVCKEVEARGGETPTVASGFADELHRRGHAASRDLVIQGDRKILGEVLGEMGFTREGRYYVLLELELLVECQDLGERDEDLVESRQKIMLTWSQIERTARETKLKACRLDLVPEAPVRRKPRDLEKLRLLGKLCQVSIDKYPLVRVGDRLVLKGY